jgi:hypothetical protein
MIFHMSDGKGKQEVMEVDTYSLKYYEPSNCL